MIKLSASILSADFAELGGALEVVERAGVHYAHIDVMDGHFVPNITIGAPVVKSIRSRSKLVFDVHLMISEPEKYVDQFISVGADIVCFHYEASRDPLKLIKTIKDAGKKAAVAIKPATPVDTLFPLAAHLDMALIMSVEPGFGGQSLIPETLKKAGQLRSYADSSGISLDIEMDGGIKLSNVREVIASGVNVIVAGTEIFHAPDIPSRVKLFNAMSTG